MTEIRTLKNQRAGRRGQVTTLIQKINNEKTSESPSTKNISTYIAEIIRQKDKLLQLDDSILDETKESEIQDEIASASEVIMTIESVLEQNKTETIKATPRYGAVKLPDIKLIKFSGDPLRWVEFWDLFRSSIHERTDLPNPAKFHYLISQLEGEAAKLLSGFDHTAAEYEEAINLLKTTYGKEKMLIQARLNALFDVKCTDATPTSLSDFRSTYEGHLRALKSLGPDVEAAGFVFSELLLRKLPPETRDNINRANNTDTWTLEDFRKAIADEIGHLYAANRGSLQNKGSKDYFDSSQLGRELPNSASFNVTAKNRELACRYCEKSHGSTFCSVYNTAEKRTARVKELKLCFNCLRANHSVSMCSNSGRCRVCGRKHHTSLCTNSNDTQVVEKTKKQSALDGTKRFMPSTQRQMGVKKYSKENHSSLTVHSKSHDSIASTGILPTAVLSIIHDEQQIQCKALFDTGSQKSFISSKIVNDLQLPVKARTTLCVDGFGSVGVNKSYDIVALTILGNEGSISMDAVVVNSMPSRLMMPGRAQTVKKLLDQGYALADKTIDSDNYSDTSLLVGIDNYFSFMYNSQLQDALFAIPSKVGILVAGKVPPINNCVSHVTTVLRISSYDSDNTKCDLSVLWNLEQIGITTCETEDTLALRKFKDSIKFRDGRYTASLPWKDDCPQLPTNRILALNRLQSLLSSLKKKPDILKTYDHIIHEQLQLGFIEKIDEKTTVPVNSKIHYIPHHAVHKQSVTTPIRVVYNCSAKMSKHSPSLNECLLTGPNLINDLAAVLLRFRLNKFACISDIEKAYLMVGLNEADSHSCRFFWPSDPYDDGSKIQTYKFKVVLFGSTASQFLLNATIDTHLRKIDTSEARALLRNIYVDNVQNTFSTESEIINFYVNTKKIMSAAGFKLREWRSNSASMNRLMETVGDAHSDAEVKVLGLVWDTHSDQLMLPSLGTTQNPLTKRTIVREVAKIFDPLGLICPVTVRGKIFIQKLWKSNLAWDERIPEHLSKEWQAISADVRFLVDHFSVKRCLHCRKDASLHIFADASSKCYGAVAYFVSGAEVDFLLAKTRLAPMNPPTLPQMELTAVTIAARMARFLLTTFSEEVDISRVYLWSDSQITIHWLKTTKLSKAKIYVQQRVKEIKTLIPNAHVKFVAGADNPADLLTRGLSTNQFLKSSIWTRGPLWLTSEWPQQQLNVVVNDPVVKQDSLVVTIPKLTFPVERYSKFQKAVRVLAYVFLYIFKLNPVLKKSSFVCDVNFSTGLSVKLLARAEKLLIVQCQNEHFLEIINYLKDPTRLSKPTLVRQLNLFLRDDVIRTKGRIDNSLSPCEVKEPILLPNRSYLTKLIILDYHERNLHAGVNELLASIRQKFWVPKGRAFIKHILKSCVKCLKVQGKSFPSPPTPPLPADRVRLTRAFQVTGVDYTGAISVRGTSGVSKAYIALFTCAVTRAVHLEVVNDNTEGEFMNAFIRFVSRRSYPQIIYSDNAKTFVAANETLKTIANKPFIQNSLSKYRIEWKFITPRAAWHGAMWERLIGIMKISMKKVIGSSLLSLVELQTIVVQLEAKMNDRPLTYISSDSEDLQPLTPSMLLLGFRLTDFPATLDPQEIVDPTYLSNDRLCKRKKYVELLVMKFHKRWQMEYLTSLRENYNFVSDPPTKFPELGDIVLVHADMHRVNWKMGLVVGLLRGPDGFVRTVTIKTDSGVLTRPVTKLYPLEVRASELIDYNIVKESDSFETGVRVRRAAAIKAIRANRKLLMEQ